jgi:hypothetical protein
MESAHPSDLHIAITKIVLCIKEVKMWLVEHKLKMNDSKTEVILLGHRRQLNQCQLSSFEIDHTEIILSTCVRDLGVWLDAELSFTNHIAKVCSASFAYLRVIGRLWKSLSEPLRLILVYAFVVSRVRYCGSIYNGVSKSNLNTLQRVLNVSLCLVTGLGKSQRISCAASRLGFMNIHQLVSHHTNSLIYSIFSTGKPTHLASFLSLYEPPRNL